MIREGETLKAAVFVYYGASKPTNNKAEMQAAVDAMEAFKSSFTLCRGEQLNLIGDSKLIIQFLRRECRPGDKSFVDGTKRI